MIGELTHEQRIPAMNGMKKKALQKRHAARYTCDGIPRDACKWTVKDWADLHRAMESVRAKIAARHKVK